MHKATTMGVRAALAVVAGFLALVGSTACSPRGTGTGFFVIVQPSDTLRFLSDVESILKEGGFRPNRGKAVDDTGGVLYVIEGVNLRSGVWVQNVILSGEKDPANCGVHAEPYPDPAQFKVLGTARLFGSSDSAMKAEMRLSEALQLRGYDVRPVSVPCGLSAING